MPSTIAGGSFFGRVALGVAAFAVSLVLFPLLALAPTVLPIAWPRWVGDALFFWPQYLLLPGGVRPAAGTASVPTGAGVLPIAAVAFWLVAITVYSGLTLRWRKRWMLPLLFLSVAVTAELALLLLGTAGWVPVLDGL
jgi:hypothetical protein